MLEQLIKNQKTYAELRLEWLAASGHSEMIERERADFEAAAELTKDVIARLVELEQVVSIQPMTSPTGEASWFRYKVKEQKADYLGLTLEVFKQKVSARTLRLSTRLSDPDAAEQIAEELINQVLSLAIRLASKSSRVIKKDTPEQGWPESLSERIALNINRFANQIASTTRRGVGNFVIADAETLKLLNFDPLPQDLAAAVDREQRLLKIVGSLNRKYIKVYSSHLMPPGKFLIGYKGAQTKNDGSPYEEARLLDSGIVYCPYVPVLVSGSLTDPVTYKPVTALMTRGAVSVMKDEEGGSFGSSANYYRLLEVA